MCIKLLSVIFGAKMWSVLKRKDRENVIGKNIL